MHNFNKNKFILNKVKYKNWNIKFNLSFLSILGLFFVKQKYHIIKKYGTTITNN